MYVGVEIAALLDSTSIGLVRPPQYIPQQAYNTKGSATQAPLLFKLTYYPAILALSQKWLLTFFYLPIKLVSRPCGVTLSLRLQK